MDEKSFNRTNEELKLAKSEIMRIISASFNRTNVELKHCSGGNPYWYTFPFNRTNEELKHLYIHVRKILFSVF